MSEVKLNINTFLPKWQSFDYEGKPNEVYVQAVDQNTTLAGHSTRPYEECFPHMCSRDVWENSPLFRTMRDEAIADRQRKIDELK